MSLDVFVCAIISRSKSKPSVANPQPGVGGRMEMCSVVWWKFLLALTRLRWDLIWSELDNMNTKCVFQLNPLRES